MRTAEAAFTSLAAVLLFVKTEHGARAITTKDLATNDLGGVFALALTKADDYPIHQSPEPIAYAGTDRNFYDRYFFNGYSPDGTPLLRGRARRLSAPERDGRRLRRWSATACRPLCTPRAASTWSGWTRPSGRSAIEVVEPLQSCAWSSTTRTRHRRRSYVYRPRAPIEEPRFTYRIGPRTLMDYTRLTQNGRYQGWIEVDGKRETGRRLRRHARPLLGRAARRHARSAGGGAAAPAAILLAVGADEFRRPILLYHNNADADGTPWNRRAVWAPTTAPRARSSSANAQIDLEERHAACQAPPSSRSAKAASNWTATFTPMLQFLHVGLGYGHPEWAHGLYHGELAVEREDIVLSDVDVRQPHHLHIQALCDVTCRDGEGRIVARPRRAGAARRSAPHAPSGFKRRWISRHECALPPKLSASGWSSIWRSCGTPSRSARSRAHSRRRQPRDLSLRRRRSTARTRG